MVRPICLIVSLVLSSLFGLDVVQRTFIEVDAEGRPLDYCGNVICCPRCNRFSLISRQVYDYRCDECGHECRVRYLSELGRKVYSDCN